MSTITSPASPTSRLAASSGFSTDITASVYLKRLALRTTVAILSLVVFLVLLIVVGVIPLREYVAQKNATANARERLTMLTSKNAALIAKIDSLNNPTQIEHAALADFGLVRPGQELTLMSNLPGQKSLLSSPMADSLYAPAPSEKTSEKVSAVQAILYFVAFWR